MDLKDRRREIMDKASRMRAQPKTHKNRRGRKKKEPKISSEIRISGARN
jgi:hypothetical protein